MSKAKEFTIESVSEALGCSHFTVRSWIASGRIKNVGGTGGAGHKALVTLDELKTVLPYASRSLGTVTFKLARQRLLGLAPKAIKPTTKKRKVVKKEEPVLANA